MSMNYEKQVREQVRMAEEADKLKQEIGGTASDDSVVKLKNDGNVTRQIMDAIGHETLQSYYSER